jgi:RNA polymerase sigma-70 factor (sigma-E family)
MDDEGFSSYVAARWSGLVRTLVLLGCDAHEAEDVAQTALVRCYAAWERVRMADDLDAYVYRSLLNTWAKSRRRRWWGERPTDVLPEWEEDDAFEDATLRHDIEKALGRLSPEHRQVLVLRYVADLSESQVAQVLGVPPGTVKSRTSRAIAHVELADLREELS